MKFKVGEICLINGASEDRAPNKWIECEIKEKARANPHGLEYLVEVPLVRSDYSDGYWNVAKKDLKKLPPPNEKTDWEDCIWKPIKETV